MKRLFANGCSMTAGGGLEHKYTFEELHDYVSWPAHLSSMLGFTVPHVNLAIPCGSNARTFRTTAQWISEQTPADVSDTLFVIQLTEGSRWEYQVKNRSDLVEVSAFSYRSKPEHHHYNTGWARVKVGTHMGPEWLKESAKHSFFFYEGERVFWLELEFCLAMKAMLDGYGAKYYFVHGVSMDYLNTLPLAMQQIYRDYIAPKMIWNVFDGVSTIDICHPCEKGHREVASQIYKQMH